MPQLEAEASHCQVVRNAEDRCQSETPHTMDEVEGEGVSSWVNVGVRVGVMVPVPAWVLLTIAGETKGCHTCVYVC